MNTKSSLPSNQLSRRDFLGLSAAFCLSLPIPTLAGPTLTNVAKPVQIGLITDLHHDIMHDGKQRLERFVEQCHQRKVDGIAQLGDFAYPNAVNKPVIDLFNQSHSTRLHVIGNHDTDAGHTKEQCLQLWEMPSRYYAQNILGIWFIVLDGNDKGSPSYKSGYPAYVNSEQIDWLKATLGELQGPIVVISHQPLIGPLSVDNATELQQILAAAANKIILAINGHSHIDSLIYEQGIPYLTINSASYYWLGDKFKHESYPPAIHQTHPWISRTCPYRDALFTIMTIDPLKQVIRVEGKQSEWVGKSPTALGFTDEYKPLAVGKEIIPGIRARTIRYKHL